MIEIEYAEPVDPARLPPHARAALQAEQTRLTNFADNESAAGRRHQLPAANARRKLAEVEYRLTADAEAQARAAALSPKVLHDTTCGGRGGRGGSTDVAALVASLADKAHSVQNAIDNFVRKVDDLANGASGSTVQEYLTPGGDVVTGTVAATNEAPQYLPPVAYWQKA